MTSKPTLVEALNLAHKDMQINNAQYRNRQRLAACAMLAALKEITIAAEADGWDVDDNEPILNAARAAIAAAKVAGIKEEGLG